MDRSPKDNEATKKLIDLYVASNKRCVQLLKACEDEYRSVPGRNENSVEEMQACGLIKENSPGRQDN